MSSYLCRYTCLNCGYRFEEDFRTFYSSLCPKCGIFPSKSMEINKSWTNPENLHKLGCQMVKAADNSNEFGGAYKLFKKSVELDNSSSCFWKDLGECCIILGRVAPSSIKRAYVWFKEAIDAFEKAITLDSDLNQEDSLMLQLTYGAALRAYANEFRTNSFLEAGKIHDPVLEHFKKLLKQYPEEPVVKYCLSEVILEKGSSSLSLQNITSPAQFHLINEALRLVDEILASEKKYTRLKIPLIRIIMSGWRNYHIKVLHSYHEVTVLALVLRARIFSSLILCETIIHQDTIIDKSKSLDQDVQENFDRLSSENRSSLLAAVSLDPSLREVIIKSHEFVPSKAPYSDKNLIYALDKKIEEVSREKRRQDYRKTFPFEADLLISLEQEVGKKMFGEHNHVSFKEGRVTNITIIDIGLSSFPEVITEFSSLQVLNLSNNPFKSISDSIGHLKSLEELNLSGMDLKSLPENFGKLVNLKKVNLSGNKLKSLPESFGNLENLQEIWLFGNSLTKLPGNFGNLINLRELLIQNNSLPMLSENFGNLINLRKLYLDKNQLTTLHGSMGNLVNLRYLDLQNNDLKEMPETIGNLLNLKKLYLRGNDHLTLPNSIGKLKELEELTFSSFSFPESLIDLINLKYIGLSGQATYYEEDEAFPENIKQWLDDMRD